MRVVAKTAKCRRDESKLSWNTEGPAGKAGVIGQQGKEGPQGKEGLAGKEGPRGKEGPEGKEGPAGPAGGPTGPEGPRGKEGPAGKDGEGGTSAGYSAANNSMETLSESEEVPIVQKELPAGSYMVSANAGLFASASTATRVGAICSLWDSPGELFKTPSVQIDKAIWTMELAENPMTTHFEGASTLSLLAPLTTPKRQWFRSRAEDR